MRVDRSFCLTSSCASSGYIWLSDLHLLSPEEECVLLCCISSFIWPCLILARWTKQALMLHEMRARYSADTGFKNINPPNSKKQQTLEASQVCLNGFLIWVGSSMVTGMSIDYFKNNLKNTFTKSELVFSFCWWLNLWAVGSCCPRCFLELTYGCEIACWRRNCVSSEQWG